MSKTTPALVVDRMTPFLTRVLRAQCPRCPFIASSIRLGQTDHGLAAHIIAVHHWNVSARMDARDQTRVAIDAAKEHA